jgi:RNA polymerase sigma-70 factor (ECF subfamily)
MDYELTSRAIPSLVNMHKIRSGAKKADISDPDYHVIEKIRDGNYQAFGELVRRYEDFAYTLIRSLVGNDDAAKDITQEVFLRAYKSIRRFEQRSSFKTWLYRIAYNTTMAHLARERKNGDRENASARDITDGSYENFDKKLILEKIIGMLKPEYRAVIILHYYDGLKYGEIAEALDCPIGTIKIRLYRAKYELKKLWSRYEIRL